MKQQGYQKEEMHNIEKNTTKYVLIEWKSRIILVNRKMKTKDKHEMLTFCKR